MGVIIEYNIRISDTKNEIGEEKIKELKATLHTDNIYKEEHYSEVFVDRATTKLSENLADELKNQVWNCLGKFFPIEIEFFYIEQTPTDDFEFNKEDYDKFLKNKKEVN